MKPLSHSASIQPVSSPSTVLNLNTNRSQSATKNLVSLITVALDQSQDLFLYKVHTSVELDNTNADWNPLESIIKMVPDMALALGLTS